MSVQTLHHQARVLTRSRAGRRLRRRTIFTVRAIGDRICGVIDASLDWLCAPEAWAFAADLCHFGLVDLPSRRRRYCAVIMDANGEGEREFGFEDCASLLEGSAESAARTVMVHMAVAVGEGEPLPYRIIKASRHGDFLMVQGVVGDGEWEFIAFASAV